MASTSGKPEYRWHGRGPGRISRKRWAAVRAFVLERDGWRCRVCGKAGRLEVDHVKPLADGGAPYDPDNCQAICRPCHFAKTTREKAARGEDPQRAAWRRLLTETMGG